MPARALELLAERAVEELPESEALELAAQIKDGYDYFEELKDAKEGLAEQVQQLESSYQACMTRFAATGNVILDSGEELFAAVGSKKKMKFMAYNILDGAVKTLPLIAEIVNCK